MAIDTANFAGKNLQAFKDRMRITSGDEDERLKRMLASSIVATTSLVGATELDEMLTELTFERARYVYHDALDEFQKNYADEIELQTFLNSLKEG
nr:MAG TPA: Head Tail Connector Protein [Bacteriophage sp.]